MQLSTKKINTNRVYSIALWLVLLLIVIYEAYLVYGLNQDLQISQTVVSQKVNRFDFTKFDQALKLYSSAGNAQDVGNIVDPFNNGTPAPSGTK